MSVSENNSSGGWRIQSKFFFNFADALTARMIQV
jgi:hypothetical protein